MKATYVTALTELILAGVPAKTALDRVRSHMERREHLGLWRRVLSESHRILTVKLRQQEPVVTVAKESDCSGSDIKAALAALGAENKPRCDVDDTLIGGFVVEYQHQRTNNSYKRHLVRLYRSITT